MTPSDFRRKIPNLKAEGLSYKPQLDSLRAVAVFLVMLQHFPLPYLKFLKDAYMGGVGVDLFFVLSGFLITSILLYCRNAAESPNNDKYNEIRLFYIRRFFRIFPLFYLTLFTAAILNVGYVRETFLWHFFYLTNFYMALKGVLLGAITHFWSLAVEEQFYLIWPWIIIFVPRKYLFQIILLFIVCGPCFRFISLLAKLNGQAFLYMPFSSWDALGLGALLAFMSQVDNANKENKVIKLAKAGLYVGLPIFLIDIVLRSMLINSTLQRVFGKTIMALFFVWLIFKASQGFKGAIGKILGYRPLVYLGKISYGMYIFHNFMPGFVRRFFGLLNLPYPASEGVILVILVFATIVAAALSWHFMERPLIGLKNRFKYQVAPRQKKLHLKTVV